MSEKYIYTQSLYERDPAIVRAEAEYQEAIKKCLAGEITLDEMREYQYKVFNACNNTKDPFNLDASKRKPTQL
ncbi:hypothetical protein [Flavobacterium geliluteum]|uniref:Antitoxin VbhA domain-containing protein n=1 Tax=Flavobacterium geliluteum TaxID=2816120 RepID=A0A940X821_9FLAO|nr:hypothetical protein [Flavobacterium geliluteum]MBP4140148.1 hypothetical protein [Flavobacterium geliluteum]